MFNSPYSKILHDPECQANCCSGLYFSSKLEHINDRELFYNITSSSDMLYPNKNSIPNTGVEQILFNVISNNLEVPVYHEVPSQTAVDSWKDSWVYYEKPTQTTGYVDWSIDSEYLTEMRRKQRTYCKPVMKRKRKRTVFTTEQIIIMEGVFKKRPYVTKAERLYLTRKLNISEKAIKIWFQNRRRVTEKRENDQQSDSSHSDSPFEEACDSYTSRLNYIESQINKNADEFGFVTLDSESLTELVQLIDIVLSRKCQNSVYESKRNEEQKASYIMYEPISPESLNESHNELEDISKWEPSLPEESLQRLIDIQSVLFN